MKKIVINVVGMTCNHCEQRIEKSLKVFKNIKEAKASFKTGQVVIEYNENKITETNIKDIINDLGYKYKGIDIRKRTPVKQVILISLIIIVVYIITGLIFGFNFLSFIPSITANTPLLMLFTIGVLTSIHCIGMCGAINLTATMTKDNKPSFKRPIAYNLGRILSYTITGAIVGGIGSVMSFNGTLQGIVILATAIVMLMVGLSMLGWLPEGLHRFLPRIPRLNNYKYNKKGPFVIGLLNGLMPCGPLQAMQLYALSTGSILMGALSMFIFSLGTVPLVFLFGLIFTTLKSNHHVLIGRISSVLVILLSLVMINRAFTYLGLNINQTITNVVTKDNYDGYEIATIKDNRQYVTIELTNRGYKPILVQKGIPVTFNIVVDDIRKYGCTNAILIPSFNIEKDLNTGDNIINFTPMETGDFMYSCWMRMVTSNIKVVDNLSEVSN